MSIADIDRSEHSVDAGPTVVYTAFAYSQVVPRTIPPLDSDPGLDHEVGSGRVPHHSKRAFVNIQNVDYSGVAQRPRTSSLNTP